MNELEASLVNNLLDAERKAHANTQRMVEVWTSRSNAHRQAHELEKSAHAETRAKYAEDVSVMTDLLEIESERDACTPAERKVLQEMAAVPIAVLHAWRVEGTVWASNAAVVELARRGENL